MLMHDRGMHEDVRASGDKRQDGRSRRKRRMNQSNQLIVKEQFLCHGPPPQYKKTGSTYLKSMNDDS